jgi:hypothetical protein
MDMRGLTKFNEAGKAIGVRKVAPIHTNLEEQVSGIGKGHGGYTN